MLSACYVMFLGNLSTKCNWKSLKVHTFRTCSSCLVLYHSTESCACDNISAEWWWAGVGRWVHGRLGGLSSNLSIELSQCSCRNVAHGQEKKQHISSANCCVSSSVVVDVPFVSVGWNRRILRIRHGRSWRSRNCVPSWRCGRPDHWEMYIRNIKKWWNLALWMFTGWIIMWVNLMDMYDMLSMLEHETLAALNTETTNCRSLMVSLAPLLEARAKEGYCFPLNPVWPVLWLHRNMAWISWGKGVFDKVPNLNVQPKLHFLRCCYCMLIVL